MMPHAWQGRSLLGPPVSNDQVIITGPEEGVSGCELEETALNL